MTLNYYYFVNCLTTMLKYYVLMYLFSIVSLHSKTKHNLI